MSLSEADRKFIQDLKKLNPSTIANLLCKPDKYDCDTCPYKTNSDTLPCKIYNNCTMVLTDEMMIADVVVSYFSDLPFLSDEEALKKFRAFNQEVVSERIDELISKRNKRRKRWDEQRDREDDERRSEEFFEYMRSSYN